MARRQAALRRYLASATVAAGVLAALGGCTEDLAAPGEGACPAFCPPEQVGVVDSVLSGVVVSDSAFDGYVLPREAGGMQLVRNPAGPTPTSRAVARMLAFAERLALASNDTTTGAILATDSFTMRATILARGGVGLELEVYRLPVSVEAEVLFPALDPFFDDSLRIGTLTVPDSAVPGDTISVRFDSLAFPTFDADERVVAIGLALAASSGDGFVSLGALEGGAPLQLVRHVQFDSAGTTVPRRDGRLPQFDTYAAPLTAIAPDGLLRVGGAPSARALLRFALPGLIVDSSRVVRATLVLVPGAPVDGAPGDTLRIIAQGLATDVGAKSPLLTVAQDSIPLLIAAIPAGTLDTVRLDVTALLLRWAANPTRPRAVMVRALPEGNSLTQAAFGSSLSVDALPAMHITYVPPLTLGGR